MLILLLISNILSLCGLCYLIYRLRGVASPTIEDNVKGGEVSPTIDKPVVAKRSPIYLTSKHSQNLAKRLMDRESEL